MQNYLDSKKSLWPWSEANQENDMTETSIIKNEKLIHVRTPSKIKKKAVYKIHTLGFDSLKEPSYRKGGAGGIITGSLSPTQGKKALKLRITGHHVTSTVDLNKTNPENSLINGGARKNDILVVQSYFQNENKTSEPKRSSTAPWNSSSESRIKVMKKGHQEIDSGEIIKGQACLVKQMIELDKETDM